MRHVRLTCKNHPTLRWMCKEIAFTDTGGYNGARNIFFLGETPELEDWKVKECACSSSLLIRAPEDNTQ